MIQRFHADPRIETVRLLLQEQIPIRAPIEHPHPQEIGVIHPVHPPVSLDAWHAKPSVPYPQLHYLSNGNYSLLITAAGSGYSRWRETDLTRWRADTTLDNFGTWLYIRDQQTNQLWSASFQPTAIQPATQDVRFYPHTVEFLRRDGNISTRLRIAIAPDADVEIRSLTVTNHGESPRDLILASFAEVILAPRPVEQRHPAYNKLFIESEYIADGDILLFRRRPRSAQDKPIYLAHFAVDERDDLQITSFETDRTNFLGRGRTPRAPAALQSSSKFSNTSATLDPIFALQANIVVPGYESFQLAFVTLAAASRKDALDLARRYHQWHQISRAFDDTRAQAEKELIQIGLSSQQLEQVQKLLSVLLYPAAALRADTTTLAANTLGQSGLWPFSISGDYPILLLYIREEKDLDLLNELIQAHTYWRRRGLMIDLALLNRRETSYDQDFQGKIYRLLNRTNSDDWLGKRGGIFVLREDQMSEAERVLLATTARVVLDGEAGSLAHQLEKLDRLPVRLPHFVSILPPLPDVAPSPPLERPSDLLFDNGMGGFTPDGREYIIYLDRGQWTPAPWINVIANPEFGFLVSEAGMGCTWAINSGENRLTPWHNDPVSDPPSEAIYLRDEDTGQIWSPTPLPARAAAPYLIRHGIGYSIFEHRSHDLDQVLRLFAIPDAPVKIAQLKMKNTSSRTRRINITYYADWVLGTTHEDMAQYIVPEYDSTRFALLAHNPYNHDFGQRVAFLAASRELQGLTTDRAEFLGLLGSYIHPDALERVGLTASAQAGTDPSAAMQLLLWLAPGETKEVTFLLGQGADHADALKLITHYQNVLHVQSAWESLDQFWDDKIGGIQIKTPDAAMDLLINRWLPYQALACRIWGRTAFYQSSGAFGYRDQLQDVLAFIYTRPEITRKHILLAAGHQFEEGDVLHWWHPPAARGIRTRITDNLLWLPYLTAQYIKVTDDRSILYEQIPFLSAEPLKDGEHERYGEFPTGTVETLYEHCRRALTKGTTSGPHGLPLMGEGDWNDGMNNVGMGGTGESVWLGWFLYSTLTSFASVCDLITAAEQAALYRQQADTLIAALEAHGWDGNWYRRAYYDDGKPLGSVENRDCKIDSISQSWAVISGAASPERARTAMESLDARLVHRDHGLILLLTPPFDRTIRDPGYIKGYLPGIRENGGQYTHGALWAIWAFAELGEGDHTTELFRLINPINHADTPEKILRYRVEPYVVSADVYGAWPHVGRGGWTWYTGSAGWMYRLGVEKILGLQREGDHLKIESCIPKVWRKYEIHYRFGSAIYHIHVENPLGVNGGVMQLSFDGELLDGKIIALTNDGREHTVNVTLG
jgi:cyclic beta-1,2-glucan synthetase